MDGKLGSSNKSSYCWCHLNHKVAIEMCKQLPEANLAMIALQLTFSRAPCPYEWGMILNIFLI